MVGFVERWRVRALVLAVVALAGALWMQRRSEPAPSLATASSSPTPSASSPCLEPRPRGGIYAVDDGSMHVAIVDGCTAARLSEERSWLGPIVTPHAPSFGARDGEPRSEVVLVPNPSKIAQGGDGTVLRVASDRTLTVFQRHSWNRRATQSPARSLTPIATFDDRDAAAIVGLLAHDELAVQAAALARLQHERLDDAACAAIRDWLVRARHDEPRRGIASIVLRGASDRCLVPAIRHAIDEPSLRVPASMALARLGTPAEKAEALLAVLDATRGDSRHQAAEELAEYLHPDHCGPHDPDRCLAAPAAAELERALHRRLDLNEPTSAAIVLHALRAYLGDERHATLAFGLAATAPCSAIELLIAPARVTALPAENVAPAFSAIRARRGCRDGRTLAAFVLAHRLAYTTAPEADWSLLAAYLHDLRLSRDRRLQVAANLSVSYGCYPHGRDQHPAADAVLARVHLRRCPATP